MKTKMSTIKRSIEEAVDKLIQESVRVDFSKASPEDLEYDIETAIFHTAAKQLGASTDSFSNPAEGIKQVNTKGAADIIDSTVFNLEMVDVKGAFEDLAEFNTWADIVDAQYVRDGYIYGEQSEGEFSKISSSKYAVFTNHLEELVCVNSEIGIFIVVTNSEHDISEMKELIAAAESGDTSNREAMQLVKKFKEASGEKVEPSDLDNMNADECFAALEKLAQHLRVYPTADQNSEKDEWEYNLFVKYEKDRPLRQLPPSAWPKHFKTTAPCIGLEYGEGSFAHVLVTDRCPQDILDFISVESNHDWENWNFDPSMPYVLIDFSASGDQVESLSEISESSLRLQF